MHRLVVKQNTNDKVKKVAEKYVQMDDTSEHFVLVWDHAR